MCLCWKMLQIWGRHHTWGMSNGNCEVFSTLSPKERLVREESKATLVPNTSIFLLWKSCIKLKSVFVTNYKMYLSQVVKCICLNLSTKATLVPNTSIFLLWKWEESCHERIKHWIYAGASWWFSYALASLALITVTDCMTDWITETKFGPLFKKALLVDLETPPSTSWKF